jgi:hypothetical protein
MDENYIRAQSAILDKTLRSSLFLFITVFSARMVFYPCGKHGWRARARNGRFWHAAAFRTPDVALASPVTS